MTNGMDFIVEISQSSHPDFDYFASCRHPVNGNQISSRFRTRAELDEWVISSRAAANMNGWTFHLMDYT